MTYRLLTSILLSASLAAPVIAADYNDPASTYAGMELLEPDPENLNLCQPLPLAENFSDATHYDGQSYLPIGWATTGSAIWRTGSVDALSPYSGTYYMLTTETMLNRDERAYTPFFNLQKGITYTISFATHQDATELNGVTNLNTIVLKVGTQQDADFLPVTIASISKANKPNVWDLHSYTFCPAESGPYCFCFELQGVPLSGFPAIDDVRITSAVDLERVEPLFHPFGIYNVADDGLISMKDDPVYMVSYTPNGTPTAWTADGASTIDMLPSGHAAARFNASGEYEVTLEAANAVSTKTLTKTVKISHFDEATDNLTIRSFDINTAKTYGRREVPAYASDPNGLDYITGPNHYYSAFGEYFQVPWNAELSISSIQILLTGIRYCPTQSNKDYQADKIIRVKFYGTDGAGRPDESKNYGQFTYKLGDVLGTTGLGASGGELRNFMLPRPVNVTGPFFLVFEFSEDIIIDPIDPNVGRTFGSFGVGQHMHGYTTLWCKPYALPLYCPAELDEWCPVSDLDKNLKGMALNAVLSASYTPSSSGVSIEEAQNEISCRLEGSSIIISGAEASAPVKVYNTAGALLINTTAAGSIDASALDSGIYLITVSNHTFRIAK